MIDVHSHVFPFGDDGAKTQEDFIEYINAQKKENIEIVFLTPHFRKGILTSNQEELIKQFNDYYKKSKNSMNFLLSREIYVDEEHLSLINSSDVLNCPIILVEFDYNIKPDDYVLEELLYMTKQKGNKVIVAHIERYRWINYEIVHSFKRNGYFLQMNSATVKSKVGSFKGRKITKLIKKGLIDFIGTDYHNLRRSKTTLSESYRVIEGKFGKELADRLHYLNAKKLLTGGKNDGVFYYFSS